MNEETKRKECLDQRNSYIKDLSTGSFGLSFIFVDKIVQDTIQRPGILVYSWVMFACSVICCLLSFICSKAGFKKAIEEIDEQIENPKEAKGVVKREVLQVVSKGTIMNSESLDEKSNNYIGSVIDMYHLYLISYADISTGEFNVLITSYPTIPYSFLFELFSFSINLLITRYASLP